MRTCETPLGLGRKVQRGKKLGEARQKGLKELKLELLELLKVNCIEISLLEFRLSLS